MSTPTSAAPAEMVEIINPFGDIKLHVETATTGAATYLVSSHILQSASGFFRAMLSPTSNFMEASQFHQHLQQANKDPFPLTINIEGHCLNSLDSILRAIHGKILSENVKKAPSMDTISAMRDLYAMAQLAEYLQCGEALKEWIEKVIPEDLMAKGKLHIHDLTKYPDIPQMLTVASVFRHEEMFKAATAFCILNMSGLTEDKLEIVLHGTRQEPRGGTKLSDVIPGKLLSKFNLRDIWDLLTLHLGKLKARRDSIVHATVQRLVDALEAFKDKDSDEKCRIEDETVWACVEVQIGIIYQTLYMRRMDGTCFADGLCDDGTIHEMVNCLWGQHDSADTSLNRLGPEDDGGDHLDCNPLSDTFDELRETVDDLGLSLDDLA